VRRPDEHARHHSRPLDVGNVISAAGEKALILFAPGRRADPDHLGHCSLSFLRRVHCSGAGSESALADIKV
jgi:hypothetical protein